MTLTLTRKLNSRKFCTHAIGLVLGVLMLGGCEAAQPTDPNTKESPMWITIAERRFAITLADNPAARAFAAQFPMTLDMEELNGNEKMFDLPTALPQNPSRPGTIRNGDLMLYGARTLVLFYMTFDSSYSYTRLGRVDDPTGLEQALGQRGVRVIFSKD